MITKAATRTEARQDYPASRQYSATRKAVLPVLSPGMAAKSSGVVFATLPRHGKPVQFRPAFTSKPETK